MYTDINNKRDGETFEAAPHSLPLKNIIILIILQLIIIIIIKTNEQNMYR